MKRIDSIIGVHVARNGGVTVEVEPLIILELQRMQLATASTHVRIEKDGMTIEPTRVGSIKIMLKTTTDEVDKIIFDDEAMQAFFDTHSNEPALA